MTDLAAPAPARFGWSMAWWGWLLVVLALVGSAAVQLFGYAVLLFGFSTCDASAVETARMHSGQLGTVILTGCTAAAWLLATWLSRFRNAVVLAGVLSTLVGAGIAYDALTTDAWAHGWCF